jgi:hypothetical protein
MKHVRLPIYDDEGMELNEHLEVSVEILERLAKTSIIYKDHVKVVPGLTVEQEMEMVNRIIAGLPVPITDRRDYYPFPKRKSSAHFLVEGDKVVEVTRPEDVAFLPIDAVEITKGRLETVSVDVDGYGSIELVDVVSKHPDEWRPIPEFSNYEMSPYRAIAVSATGKSVSINKGRIDNVLLIDDYGVTKRMSVDYLFNRVFPEL